MADPAASISADHLRAMLDNAPVNVLLADRDLRIVYVNRSSLDTLRKIERWLPVKADQVQGQLIDVFHKDPSVQRRMLDGDGTQLPHRAVISIGPEKAELLVNAVRDASGTYLGPMVTWKLITDQLKLEQEQSRLSCMVENAPINIMIADVDLNITYINPASRRTLASIEHLLPCRASDVVGKSVDLFHKNPSHQRRILADPRNLPHKTRFLLGSETLDLLATAVIDKDGRYLGPMVTWAIITEKVRIQKALKDTCSTLAASSAELSSSSTQMASSAEETISQSEGVAAATEQVDRNAQVVAASSAEMASAVQEIARNMQKTSQITGEAVKSAEHTNAIIAKLGDSSQKIGKVVKLITSIAQQTNLLALNATIEAARAGEAGKGFAVVANEVKELARQTAKATDEIGAQVEAIQADSRTSVQAIGDIGRIIQQIASISATVASATEQQSSTTTDISRNITQVAEGTKEIGRSILAVTEAAKSSGQVASGLNESSEGLSRLASELQQLVTQMEM